MPRIVLYGHEHIYAIYDVARMYFESVQLGQSSVTAGDDSLPISSMIEDDTVRTKWEQDGQLHEISRPVAGGSVKREVKRQIYQALSLITGISFPWGSLTGIRPTVVASECLEHPERLMDFYFVSKEKASLALETCRQEAAIQAKLPGDLYHCYIGIPFCRTRCLYCSFVSEEYRRYETLIPEYVAALVKEIADLLPSFKDRIQSVYIGGGTPTSLPDDLFEMLLAEVSKHTVGANFAEFTVEAGRADSITKRKCEIMKQYGVKRVCINPQTMHDETLRRIGRGHTAAQAVEAFRTARETGFETINMDFIAGLPGEHFNDFKSSLDSLLSLSPENITVHTLSLKKNSAMTRMIRNDREEETSRDQIQKIHTPNKEISDMIEYSVDVLKNAGYHPYYLYRQKDMAGGHENTGYSKTGHECLYNVAMMGDKNSIIAFGAGAMSKRIAAYGSGFRAERMPNLKDIPSYLLRMDEQTAKKRTFFHLNDMPLETGGNK